MASVVLRSVGAVVGNALLPGIGGALGGGLAGSLGNVIDSQLGLGTTVTGPRLDNLSVQDSRYGAGLPIVYGNARVAGNVLWCSDLIETKHTTTSGGKGGGVTTKTYTYSVNGAIGMCAGPIAGISTIWADSTVIYQEGVWTSGLFDGVSIYLGADDQEPDSFMESILGSGNVPAYRGLAYIVFDNLQLDDFGNRLPNLTFEIAASTETKDPSCLGQTSAALSQCAQSVQNGSMAPIALESNGKDMQTALIGGFSFSGSTATFLASAYDVMGKTPSLLSSTSSASFAIASSLADCAWSLSPDGRFVACYAQTALAVSHIFTLYDTQTHSFGPILTATLSTSSVYKNIAWLDAQHIVIDDVAEDIRGLRVFARAGTGLIDLGFTGLWGSGSGTSSKPFYGAQYTPYADGLLAYNYITGTKTLRARTVVWRDNALSLGDAYILASGLAVGTGSGMHARFLKTASGEWTLFYGTVLYCCLMSFEPSDVSAVITRPWQTITQNFGTGSTHYPVFYGDRLLVFQNGINGGYYLLSEIRLDDGCFTLSVDALDIAEILNNYDVFCAVRIDASRLLFLAFGGSALSLRQLAVIERNAVGSVASVLADLLDRAGYEDGDYDVSALADVSIQGYIVQEPMSARNAIEPLQTYTPFDLVETGGQLKAVARGGGSVVTLDSTEWRAASEDNDPPPPLLVTRAQEMDLPREVALDVLDPARNFEVNCQRARRRASSARTVQKISLPVVCSAATAKQIAETKLYTAWSERNLVRLCVSRTWLALDPADVIDLGNGNLLRIASIVQTGSLLKIEGFYSHPDSLRSAASADGGRGIASCGTEAVPSVLYAMDLPLLRDADDQPGIYVAVSGLSGWKSASVLRSSDGATYEAFCSSDVSAVAGMATTVLEDGAPYYRDDAHTVDVQVLQGSVSSCSDESLLNGANAALLGDEIIQFKTATLTGPGLYTLSGLLRGRRGTEGATGTHSVGEAFVLLEKGVVDFIPDVLSHRGQAFSFRALSSGQTLSEAQDYTLTYGMKTLCPFAPVHVKGVRSLGTSGHLTLSWIRRARVNAAWLDNIDVPLDEDRELYAVEILNGTEVVRTFSDLAEASVTYTAAQQAEDWGGDIPDAMTLHVYQVGTRFGKGVAATETV